MYSVIKAALLKSKIASDVSLYLKYGCMDDLGAGTLSLYHYMVTSITSYLVEKIVEVHPWEIWLLSILKTLLLDLGCMDNYASDYPSYFQINW